MHTLFSLLTLAASGLLAAAAPGCRALNRNALSASTAGTSSSWEGPALDPAKNFLSPVSRAQFNFQPYQLRDACLACSRDNSSVLYSCSIQFNWFDPNSVKENKLTSCTCLYSWDWDGKATTHGADNTYNPQDFMVCTKQYPSMFEMRVNGFSDPTNLTLFMSHYYRDSSLWGPPYLFAQTWAMPVLNLTLESRDDTAMSYFHAGPILANITGLQG